MIVRIFSTPDCHLCHVAVKIARRLQAEMPFELQRVDISQDSALMDRYGARIPVVVIDGNEWLAGPTTERTLREALRKARRRRPVSRILSRLRSLLTRG